MSEFSINMQKSIILVAYEINADLAKKLIQKRSGISAKFKKFQTSEIVDHVTTAWTELERLILDRSFKVHEKILYTAKLDDPLRIGKNRNEIVNNSFLMSVISDGSQFGLNAINNARLYKYSEDTDFEKRQFSILLEEVKDNFRHQEVGIFSWFEIDVAEVDTLLKKLAGSFAAHNDGELHFLEFSPDGKIYPNFTNVTKQKFEGKLAGNYSLTLAQSQYLDGIQRFNELTNNVLRLDVLPIDIDSTSENDLVCDNEQTNVLSDSGSIDFSQLGDEPYNYYFNMVHKFDDPDLAEEKFAECIEEFLQNLDMFVVSWKDLPKAELQNLLQHIESLERYKDSDYDEKVNGPLHSLVYNAWYDAE